MNWRKRAKLFGTSLLAVLLGGCVLSVDPYLSDSDVTFDASLLGVWEETSGTDRAVVSQANGNVYAIEYTSDGTTDRYEARLGRLGERLVLDLWPAGRDDEQRELAPGLMIRGHLLLSITAEPDEVRIAAIDPDRLLEELGAGEIDLPYRRSGDQLVLGGSTDELRLALAEYLMRDDVLSEPDAWRRVSGPTAGTPREGVTLTSVPVPCVEASPWRDADRLFRGDPRWLGADVAATVDLGEDRILWLFGDSWIDPTATGKRRGARIVSNSVAIQTGSDPATAAIDFYWGKQPDGSPDALFPDRDGESLWFGNGIRIDDRLVLFFSRTLRNTGTGLGFEHTGWAAALIENPDDPPPAWRVQWLDAPANPLGIMVGFASVLRIDDDVYAFGSQNPVKSHPVFVARWPASRVRRGDLGNPEWWGGERVGWIADSSQAARWPIFENGQTELSLHSDRDGRFLAVHSQGFGPADIVLRAAPAVTGPWTPPRMVYRPPEYYKEQIMIYASKAHPELTGADLVLTYATNTFEFAELFSDSDIYYPRFVRLMFCE